MKHFFKHTFIVSWAIIALACSQSKEPTGKATLTGKFSGAFPVGQIYTVKVEVPNLVLGNDFDEYETQFELDGSFSLSIPLFSPAYASFSINGEEDYGAIFLSPDKETRIEMSLDESDKIQIKLIKGQGLTPEDIDKTNKLFMEFWYKVVDAENSLSGLRFDMSPEEYRDYILNWTEEQIAIILDGTEDLSEDLKQMISKVMKWHTYIRPLFNYEGQMLYLYKHQQSEKETNDKVFTPTKPDKSYYSFLRFFDLNHPPFGNASFYSGMYKAILDNRVLNIPSLNDQPLADWIKEVKTIMTDLTGVDTGLFYDLLATHAYMQQLEEVKPLSDKQKENIKVWFKNPTFTQFLFTENEAAIKQSKLLSVVKETPKVEKEKLMDAIIAQYKGKVVVVDFWATWCGPCLQAMEEMKPLKEELQGKNIVFVYITTTSSPVKRWEKKILGIDGEHYYLSEEESKYIYNHFGINSIPCYQLYDSTGVLKHQINGFSGTEEMQKIIEELLP